MSIEQVITEMKQVFKDVPYGIDHTLKVLANAQQIMEGEGISGEERELISLVTILHDVGAIEAQRKHGSMQAKYQEEEGPAIAREILTIAGYDSETIKRVCYIVGNHHTPAKIDGTDFQILWEADLLENLPSMAVSKDPEELNKYIDLNFKTVTGKLLAQERFGG